MIVRVQQASFDPAREVPAHRPDGTGVGAEVHFVGSVRDLNGGAGVAALELEHYPGMTERELERVATVATDHWDLLDILVIHRYGRMEPGEGIVLVATWAAHRDAAFDACRYTIDTLKTTAPFWKQETRPDGSRDWVAPQRGEGEPF